jgi:hypothetical protein
MFDSGEYNPDPRDVTILMAILAALILLGLFVILGHGG